MLVQDSVKSIEHVVLFIATDGSIPLGKSSVVASKVGSDKLLGVGSRGVGTYTWDGKTLVMAYKVKGESYNVARLKNCLLAIYNTCTRLGIKEIIIPLDAFVQDGMPLEVASMVVSNVFQGKDIVVVC